MDVSALGALNLYTYQATLRKASQTSPAESARNQAVLQALTSTYAATSSSAGSTDSLSALAGSGGFLGPLVNGIYAAASAASSSGNIASLRGLASSPKAASTLLASSGSSGLAGLSSAALNPTATLALTAYTSQSGTLTQTAKASSAGIDSSDSNGIREAVRSAQATLFAGTLDLLG